MYFYKDIIEDESDPKDVVVNLENVKEEVANKNQDEVAKIKEK